MRLVVLLVLGFASLAPRDAAACPPPGPCHKYRVPPVLVEAQVQTYWRATPVRLPARFDRRAVAEFLAKSPWAPASTLTPIGGDAIAPRTLRFVAPDKVSRTPSDDRVVLLRQIERRVGTVYVEIDGVFYTLDRCARATANITGACLTYAGDLPDGTIKQARP